MVSEEEITLRNAKVTLTPDINQKNPAPTSARERMKKVDEVIPNIYARHTKETLKITLYYR